jgi:hypothetical protein
MKKILFAVPLLAILLVACDPSTENYASPGANVTPEELTSEFQLTQKTQGNNNIAVVTSPARYIKVYDASNNSLVGEGTAPIIQVVPPVAEVNYYVTTINPDGSVIKSTAKKASITEYTDLPALYDKIFGDGNGGYTTTTWTWDTDLPRYWGNGGWGSSTGPAWWGAPDPANIDTEAAGKGMPTDGTGAWFSLNLAGVNTSRGETGTVNVSEAVVKAGWDIGTMKFSGTVPLMGVLPNDNNQRCYTYQIMKADGEHLVLVAASSNGYEGWFLCFKKK